MKDDRLFVGFAGRHVEVRCGSDQLRAEVEARFRYATTSPGDDASVCLRLEVSQPVSGCVELRDSTGRSVAGSPLHVFYHVRKWITAAFAATAPDMFWLHASGVARDGRAIALAGPPGAGKSTMAAQLLQRSWRLVGDDVVPVRPGGWEALPLPFTPEVRTTAPAGIGHGHGALDQPKTLVLMADAQSACGPLPLAGVIFLEYAMSPIERAAFVPLRTISAGTLLAQCAYLSESGARTLTDAFALARAVPCYHLVYRDSARAARLASRALEGRADADG